MQTDRMPRMPIATHWIPRRMQSHSWRFCYLTIVHTFTDRIGRIMYDNSVCGCQWHHTPRRQSHLAHHCLSTHLFALHVPRARLAFFLGFLGRRNSRKSVYLLGLHYTCCINCYLISQELQHFHISIVSFYFRVVFLPALCCVSRSIQHFIQFAPHTHTHRHIFSPTSIEIVPFRAIFCCVSICLFLVALARLANAFMRLQCFYFSPACKPTPFIHLLTAFYACTQQRQKERRRRKCAFSFELLGGVVVFCITVNYPIAGNLCSLLNTENNADNFHFKMVHAIIGWSGAVIDSTLSFTRHFAISNAGNCEECASNWFWLIGQVGAFRFSPKTAGNLLARWRVPLKSPFRFHRPAIAQLNARNLLIQFISHLTFRVSRSIL